jgi:lambda family phage minor tail protein L
MAKASSNLSKQIFSLTPDTIINLYEIDFSNLQINFEMFRDQAGINIGADTVYRFTPMTNGGAPIYWQGKSFQPLPVSMEGFEHQADGRLPRPKMKIANPEGLLSAIVHSNSDFNNCKVTRKRTFARFLDDNNFLNRNMNEAGKNPYGEADPDSHYPDDVYFINRKVSEDKNFIEFELVSALELEGSQVPARLLMAEYCPWKYRCDVGCRYKGLPVADIKGKDLTSDIDLETSSLKTEINGDWKIQEWSPNGLGAQAGSAASPKGYNDGEIVKIVPKQGVDPAPMVFVCIQTHAEATQHHPMVSPEFWKKDECSKSVEACKLRFGKANVFNRAKTDGRLPFGGFPGTEKFSFE